MLSKCQTCEGCEDMPATTTHMRLFSHCHIFTLHTVVLGQTALPLKRNFASDKGKIYTVKYTSLTQHLVTGINRIPQTKMKGELGIRMYRVDIIRCMNK